MNWEKTNGNMTIQEALDSSFLPLLRLSLCRIQQTKGDVRVFETIYKCVCAQVWWRLVPVDRILLEPPIVLSTHTITFFGDDKSFSHLPFLDFSASSSSLAYDPSLFGPSGLRVLSPSGSAPPSSRVD